MAATMNVGAHDPTSGDGLMDTPRMKGHPMNGTLMVGRKPHGSTLRWHNDWGAAAGLGRISGEK